MLLPGQLVVHRDSEKLGTLDHLEGSLQNCLHTREARLLKVSYHQLIASLQEGPDQDPEPKTPLLSHLPLILGH
ncbi:hypothetical protein O3P69_016904 [Scylla paramamosain]|uniref:Uncharacterized protein n=1 Tax=Scylla paramamosain TaxID=85552 RepID=A0AAW0SIY5_SCYPA